MVLTNSSNADRIALAQHLSGEGVAGQEPCAVNRAQWAHHELRLEQVMAGRATTNRELRVVAAPLLSMCAQCPRTSLQACRAWACVDKFSGVAGGTLMRNGRVKNLGRGSRTRRIPPESAA